MNLPPYTYNGNTVTEYGRLFYVVTSNSRRGLVHFVDLEKSEDWKFASVCCCESWIYHERPCRHIIAALHAIAHWAGIPESLHEEFCDNLRFLMSLGDSLMEALERPSMIALRNRPEPEKPKQTVRKYTLPPRDSYIPTQKRS